MLFHLQRLRDISRKKSAELTRLYSQMRWLGQHNADLVLRNIDANTKMTEQKAHEAEAQTAELQCVRTALEQKEAALQCKEAELQREKATITMLTGTLED